MKRGGPINRRTRLRRTPFSDPTPAQVRRARERQCRLNRERMDKSREWREAVLKRDGYRCRRCDWKPRKQSQLHAHHYHRRSQGGRDVLSNGLALCGPCHTLVHAAGCEDWRTWIYVRGAAPTGNPNVA